MEKNTWIRFLITSAVFVLISPLGISKLGGFYWVLSPPFVFSSVLFSKRVNNIDLINNVSFFYSVSFIFILFRFEHTVTAYFGLNTKGLFWYFFVISSLQAFLIQAAWSVFRNLYSPGKGFKRSTVRSIVLTYSLIIFVPQGLVWLLTDPLGLSEPRIWSDFVTRNFELTSLVFYGILIGVFIITLTRHTPESVYYSHSLDGSIVHLNRHLTRYFIYPLILCLSLVTEYFYPGRNYPLFGVLLVPLCLYYLYFILITNIHYRYQNQEPILKESKGEPGPLAIILVMIAFLVASCFIAFLKGFLSA